MVLLWEECPALRGSQVASCSAPSSWCLAPWLVLFAAALSWFLWTMSASGCSSRAGEGMRGGEGAQRCWFTSSPKSSRLVIAHAVLLSGPAGGVALLRGTNGETELPRGPGTSEQIPRVWLGKRAYTLCPLPLMVIWGKRRINFLLLL